MATLSEIKQANKIYFERGKDRLHGVVKRSLRTVRAEHYHTVTIQGTSYEIYEEYQQYMIEKQVFTRWDNSLDVSYTVREIDYYTQIGLPERFDNLHDLNSAYPGIDYWDK